MEGQLISVALSVYMRKEPASSQVQGASQLPTSHSATRYSSAKRKLGRGDIEIFIDLRGAAHAQ